MRRIRRTRDDGVVVGDKPSWWRKDEIERPRELDGMGDLRDRAEQLERAFASELTGSASLNSRGSTLGAASALAILLVTQFSATWLDDNHWHFPDVWDTAMKVLLPLSIVLLLVCTVLAVVAVWPRRRWAVEQKERIDSLCRGDDAKEAELLLRMVDIQRAANERKSRLLRLASVPLALAIAAVVAQSMAFAFKAEPVDPVRSDSPSVADQEPSDTSLPSPAERIALAARYAPRVWVHSKERFGPVDPNEYLAHSALVWKQRRRPETVAPNGKVDPARIGARCDRAPGGCYEKSGYLARELTRPFMARVERPRGLNLRRGFAVDGDASVRRGQAGRDPDVPVYYEMRRTPDELLITYWFFYGYSRPHIVGGSNATDSILSVLSHEADWENIDVALTPDGSAPLAVYFYGHGHPLRVGWAKICKLGPGIEDCSSDQPGHPVVYSALDSHASYDRAGTRKVCGPAGCANDLTDDGWRWDTWTRPGGLRPVRDASWWGFGGAWGAVGNLPDNTGPLGPSRWKLPADPDPGDLAATGG
jgi:hypothetical protein